MKGRSVSFDGFSLHAAVQVGQDDRAGPERQYGDGVAGRPLPVSAWS